MGDMGDRHGPHDGHQDPPAEAGGPGVGPSDADDDPRAIDAATDPLLSAFLHRTDQVLTTGPDELAARRHLAAMRREAQVGGGSHGVLRVASLTAAAAAVAVVVLAGFGALPAPAQRVLSDAANRVGIPIPSPIEAPVFEAPKQQPDPQTIPGRPGGPDRSELPVDPPEDRPGLQDDGTVETPGIEDGFTPPGQDPDRPAPGPDPTPAPDTTPPEGVPGDGDAERPTPPTDDPPGRSGEVPGQQEEHPGQGDDPPGQSGTPPGQSDTPPGQSGTPPGQGSQPPEGPQDTPADERGSNAERGRSGTEQPAPPSGSPAPPATQGPQR